MAGQSSLQTVPSNRKEGGHRDANGGGIELGSTGDGDNAGANVTALDELLRRDDDDDDDDDDSEAIVAQKSLTWFPSPLQIATSSNSNRQKMTKDTAMAMKWPIRIAFIEHLVVML